MPLLKSLLRALKKPANRPANRSTKPASTAVFTAMTLVVSAGLAVDRATALELEGAMLQGGFATGVVPEGTRIQFADRTVPIAPDGRFIVGFGRDFPTTARFEVTYPDGRKEIHEEAIEGREYNVQRIDGLPPKFVTPPPETLARIKQEGALKREARSVLSVSEGFREQFVWPATGIITGVYGSQRFYNGEPRRPHYGVDVAAPAGTLVKAPAAGVVTLAEPDMYYEGGLIFLDHGLGLISAFLHLGELKVAVGDRVAQGAPLAEIGSTGRSTGAHLDWRIFWLNQRLDPTLLAGPMPTAPAQ